jgi:hypothetical protein
MDDVKKELSLFARRVIGEAKRNLRKKNASGKLASSLKEDITVSKNSFSFSIEMEDYGEFVDKGVSGKKRKYATPYTFKSKMPPPKKLDKWIVRRGLAGTRDKEGRFISRKSMQFLIARAIYNKGIKPSLFLTKPFQKYFAMLPDSIAEAYGLQVDEFLEFATRKFKNKT